MELRTSPADTPAPRTSAPLLDVEHARVGYELDGRLQVAVEDVSFAIHPGEHVMLLGPSGCGKSTLLKTIAGFIEPAGGSIRLNGRTDLSPGPDRAVVFQEFDQLFPWFPVERNLTYPLRVNGRSKADAARIAAEYLDLMGLSHAADRYPHQLSGGMKQRVAIARAMALEPVLLLMDEPFGALDAQTRSRLQRELHEVARSAEATILFVTHSIQEAVYIGHRVVVLGTPPSTVVEILDVAHLSDPAAPEFTDAMRHLRSLLSADDSTAESATFE
ncbi:NitT/TauT family transport system ATP-binding protein [Murinocardiopsis flavida]|uniref:NitT/TauT family transport system ATP-binding protein n=1 Tax=Murinocardiopsis flavida TaxID=645275 RepID=A0A2P8DTT0_9ACTN|nr:ABC transporter ATP-binding protein [Murinocardiopsis flavida]PSL00628.1 NitT/TauT family transport system ATP-binding protein [Murinocardiopsis flavida]